MRTRPTLHRLGMAILCAMGAAPSFAQDQALQDVVVSANRFEQRSFDAPGSIQSVGRDVIETSGPQINISEALNGVPGINVANRNNFSQDLQISIRGFGSRAPFGVRGVRLLIDGIPQTLPDGQGQSSQFALTSAERIEVLKGPVSLLYGNAAGGVVQTITKSAGSRPELEIYGYGGTNDLQHAGATFSQRLGNYGVVADYAHFETRGFREYSEAKRDHFNGKLDHYGESSKTTFVANILHNESQDPGSRTLAEYNSKPYAAIPDNVKYKLGKTFTQSMVGVSSEIRTSPESNVSYRAYYGARDLDNPASNSSTSTTGYSFVDRNYYGTGLGYSVQQMFGSVKTVNTIGVDVDYVIDKRTAKKNSLGVATGNLTRDEDNTALSYGGYLQSQIFLTEKISTLLGARYSNVKLEVKDRLPSTNGDASGSKSYAGTSPVVGFTYHVTPALNTYLQYGKGFETPTLNEVLYTYPGGTNNNLFNASISAAKSRQYELGSKWRSDSGNRIDMALFYVKTDQDLVPDVINATGSTFQNADTLRKGFEISGLQILQKTVALRGAATWIDVQYNSSGSRSGQTVISDGKTMPGVPNNKVFVDLSWRSSGWAEKPKTTHTESGVELVHTGSLYANSTNSAKVDPYQLVNLRYAHHIKSNWGAFSFITRVDNVGNKKYVGSVIVDQSSAAYYEPGAPRNWLVGLKYTLTM